MVCLLTKEEIEREFESFHRCANHYGADSGAGISRSPTQRSLPYQVPRGSRSQLQRQSGGHRRGRGAGYDRLGTPPPCAGSVIGGEATEAVGHEGGRVSFVHIPAVIKLPFMGRSPDNFEPANFLKGQAVQESLPLLGFSIADRMPGLNDLVDAVLLRSWPYVRARQTPV